MSLSELQAKIAEAKVAQEAKIAEEKATADTAAKKAADRANLKIRVAEALTNRTSGVEQSRANAAQAAEFSGTLHEMLAAKENADADRAVKEKSAEIDSAVSDAKIVGVNMTPEEEAQLRTGEVGPLDQKRQEELTKIKTGTLGDISAAAKTVGENAVQEADILKNLSSSVEGLSADDHVELAEALKVGGVEALEIFKNKRKDRVATSVESEKSESARETLVTELKMKVKNMMHKARLDDAYPHEPTSNTQFFGQMHSVLHDRLFSEDVLGKISGALDSGGNLSRVRETITAALTPIRQRMTQESGELLAQQMDASLKLDSMRRESPAVVEQRKQETMKNLTELLKLFDSAIGRRYLDGVILLDQKDFREKYPDTPLTGEKAEQMNALVRTVRDNNIIILYPNQYMSGDTSTESRTKRIQDKSQFLRSLVLSQRPAFPAGKYFDDVVVPIARRAGRLEQFNTGFYQALSVLDGAYPRSRQIEMDNGIKSASFLFQNIIRDQSDQLFQNVLNDFDSSEAGKLYKKLFESSG